MACSRAGCKGEIVVKKSKRGKVFYGCSEYPTCDVVFWDKPIAEACPQCQAPFLLEKYNARQQSTSRYCQNEGCGWRSDAGEVGEAPPAKADETGDETGGEIQHNRMKQPAEAETQNLARTL